MSASTAATGRRRKRLISSYARPASMRAGPTLIVQGEDDMLVPLLDAWVFRRLIANSRLRVLQDTGHVVMMERPRTFNRLPAEFLELE